MQQHLRERVEAGLSVAAECVLVLGGVEQRAQAAPAVAGRGTEQLTTDALALEPRPSLRELIEDELLMALPLVPMHERCPEPLAAPVPDEALPSTGQDDKPHPFAALARLKR